MTTGNQENSDNQGNRAGEWIELPRRPEFGGVEWVTPPLTIEQAPLPPPPRRRKILLPVFLFLATCFTTWAARGPAYASAVMFILLAHEFGHFFQAIRYGVPASLPFFIPIPARPLGTMGAFIVMQPRSGDRVAMFDIGIAGPIAGLIPALLFSIIGLQWSHVIDLSTIPANAKIDHLGEPLLFKLLAYITFGRVPEGHELFLYPVAFAGWVGIFITGLNMVPIGQLDGGHVLYSLLRERAHIISQLLLAGAMIGVVIGGYWGWSLMVALLMLVGPRHPPTANDDVPLGTGRTILGWLSLLLVVLGFTPSPFLM